MQVSLNMAKTVGAHNVHKSPMGSNSSSDLIQVDVDVPIILAG